MEATGGAVWRASQSALAFRAVRRRLTAALVLAALTALLSGCVAINGILPSQGQTGGPVRIQVSFCVNDLAPVVHAGCSIASNQTEQYGTGPNPDGEADNGSYQVLLGFRLPAGAAAPTTFSSTAGEALAFTRDASYERELARLAPAGAGKAWVGYLSAPYELAYTGAEPALQSTVAPEFGLPRPADGAPFPTPLTYRAVIGGRLLGLSNGPTAASPVDCGNALDNTVVTCVDSPLLTQLPGDFSTAISDVGILAGSATASPGQSLALPFFVRTSGNPGAGKSASLSAATTLPGASVAPQTGSVALTPGTNARVVVPVSIPRDAGPGTFDVRLTAQVTGGQTRAGVAKLTVRDRQKPVLSVLKAKPKTFRVATRKRPKRGTTVSFALSEAASVRVVVERCSKRARKKGSKRRTGRCLRFKAMRGALTHTGVQGANSLRFNGRLRGKALKAGPYRVVATATDAAGNQGERVRARFAVRR
jgi:hypothetical protein